VLSEAFTSMDVLFYHGMIHAKQLLPLEAGNTVVLTGGPMNGQSGNTNTIKVETV
jgi:pyruvate kinase